MSNVHVTLSTDQTRHLLEHVGYRLRDVRVSTKDGLMDTKAWVGSDGTIHENDGDALKQALTQLVEIRKRNTANDNRVVTPVKNKDYGIRY